jgi:hypothetical protein
MKHGGQEIDDGKDGPRQAPRGSRRTGTSGALGGRGTDNRTCRAAVAVAGLRASRASRVRRLGWTILDRVGRRPRHARFCGRKQAGACRPRSLVQVVQPSGLGRPVGVRTRAPGESILAAFARFVTEQHSGLLAAEDPPAEQRLGEVHRLVADSPALQTRERRIYDRYTGVLATLIADETAARAGDITPWVAASAILGVHRALVDHVRRQMLAGKGPRRIAGELRGQAENAIELLEHELAGSAAASRARRPPSPLATEDATHHDAPLPRGRPTRDRPRRRQPLPQRL